MTAIQIRNVPDEVSRRLKAQAAGRGQSLSDYLLDEISRIAGQPTLGEVIDRIRARGPVRDLPPVADVIREHRALREDDLVRRRSDG
ncbi:MAG: FitA-like ribbon-helix-helix domain-containing protein [Dermatophilaceae bacterium]